MPNYRRANAQGGTYFFTVVTFNRQPILCDEPVRKALRQAIQCTRKKLPFIIDGWCLLPDHLHCIWTLPHNDADFGARWGMIKRYVSKHCGSDPQYKQVLPSSKQKRGESALWQRRFWEHQIRDENDYEQHMAYIHFNPVKHGYAQAAVDWPYSTFHRYLQQGIYPRDWGRENKSFALDSFGEP